MTRDELLDEAAMSWPHWPFDLDAVPRVDVYGDWGWLEWRTGPYITNKDGSNFIDKSDYLKRRAELINEPDDSDAPVWARWKAQDEDGEWFWYRNKPECNDGLWGYDVNASDYVDSSHGKIPAGHDWRETLREVGQSGIDYAKKYRPIMLKDDTGKHYRRSYKARVTQEDLDRGYVVVNLDPYRIADVWELGGGPREHIVKKGLRGTEKGDSERDLIKQLRTALDRWEEMLTEDGL